jgi:hypothetical protein
MEKRILTPEVKAKMMGFAPVSNKTGVPFIPEEFLKDKDLKELAPVYYQRSWTEKERTDVLAATRDDTKWNENVMVELARITIVNMDNVIDIGSGETIEFIPDENGSLSKDLFNKIPFAMQAKLFFSAQKISGLGGLGKTQEEGLES